MHTIQSCDTSVTVYKAVTQVYSVQSCDTSVQLLTFLGGECRTGAGGEGGPRGILVLVLNLGGSIGSLCASTMRIIRCLEPELNAGPC